MKINALLTLSLIAALAMAVLAAGCDQVATSPNPSGSWAATLGNGTCYVLTLDTDGTFIDANPGQVITGSWTSTERQLTFHTSDGSENTVDYWIVNGDLVIGQ